MDITPCITDGLRRSRGRRWRGALMAMSLVSASASVGAQSRPDSSGYVTAQDGARLFYEIVGQGSDTVIVPAGVLLAEPLVTLGTNLTLVFYDPRGRGRSEWIGDAKRLTMADELRDLESVRTTLKIGRAGLIGFSYLGLVTALYAADHPQNVTRLALLGPVAPDELTMSRYAPAEGKQRSDSAAARFARARAIAKDTSDLKAECRRWYDAYMPVYFGDPTQVSRAPTSPCENDNESPSRVQWRVDKTMRSLGKHWDFTKKAEAIRPATLVIQGDRDFAASPDGARRWAELIPDARLIMLSGAGHFAYIERGDRVIPALTRFFTGAWPPEAMPLRTSR